MAYCPECQYPLPDDRERVGARCPGCREPLYEPHSRYARAARPEERSCPAHPGMVSVGVCAECGQAMCENCRTLWRDRLTCIVCVDRSLGPEMAQPQSERLHRQQARRALAFGGATWLLAGLTIGAVLPFLPDNPARGLAAVGIGAVGLLLTALTAVFGLGHALAALRLEGPAMGLALAGLVVNGCYLGLLLGTLTLGLWHF